MCVKKFRFVKDALRVLKSLCFSCCKINGLGIKSYLRQRAGDHSLYAVETLHFVLRTYDLVVNGITTQFSVAIFVRTADKCLGDLTRYFEGRVLDFKEVEKVLPKP